jgi:hypothetical protein
MKRKLLFASLAWLSMLASAPALADPCTDLAGDVCLKFCYSSGICNSYTTTYSGGAFTLNGNSTGTYSCPGRGFIEVDYSFSGDEDHVWYGKVKAGKPAGYGKSIPGGYMYKFSTANIGACAAEAQPQRNIQREGAR